MEREGSGAFGVAAVRVVFFLMVYFFFSIVFPLDLQWLDP